MQGTLPVIIAGLVVVFILVLWSMYYRHVCMKYINEMNSKKKELKEIIEDAKDMIEELNKFSDYIVTQMDIKNKELLINLKAYDEKLNSLEAKANKYSYKNEPVIENVYIDQVEYPEYDYAEKNINNGREKAPQISNKYKQVIEMSNQGMSCTEIARELNIGKGEIELILELGK